MGTGPLTTYPSLIPTMSRPLKTSIYPKQWIQIWRWQEMEVSFLSTPWEKHDDCAPQKSSVVLIHGFGACKEHWRNNVEVLGENRQVFALDLIGFGASEKPRSRLIDEQTGDGWIYGIDGWATQVRDFVLEQIQGPVQLVGNSIGGVVALQTAKLLEEANKPALQVILIDCAQRALDDKRLAEQSLFRRWGRPALKACVRQRWLTDILFKSLTKPGIIRRVLQVAYPSGRNVDDELVNLLLHPALESGASEAFRGFINLFKDRLAPDILKTIHTPVAMLWGESDPWEPVDVAIEWQQIDTVKSLDILPGLGHCPHDEDPTLLNSLMTRLLQQGDS